MEKKFSSSTDLNIPKRELDVYEYLTHSLQFSLIGKFDSHDLLMCWIAGST